MLEDVYALRRHAPFAHDLAPLQVEHRGVQRLGSFVDRLKDIEVEFSPDDGGGLRHPFDVVVQPVEAGGYHPGEGIGDGYVFDLTGGPPVRGFPYYQTRIEEGPYHFLYEERVALRLGEDQGAHLLGQVLYLEQVGDEGARIRLVKRFDGHRG